MAPLEPVGYLLHFEGDVHAKVPSDDMERWRRNSRRSADELAAVTDPALLCAETLGYPFDLVDDIVEDLGLSVCLDVGHIVISGFPLDEYVDRYLARTRVFHVHGISDGKDHQSLAALDPDVLSFVMQAAGTDRSRVFTMEIFGESDFHTSIATLRSTSREQRGTRHWWCTKRQEPVCS